jgi:hypothetical protein
LPHRLQAARETLALLLDGWLQAGQVHTKLRWSAATNRPEAVLAGEGLLACLAVTLMARVSEVRTGPSCSNPDCDNPVDAKRLPKPGEAIYCETCRRTGVPSRLYKRRYRTVGPTKPRTTTTTMEGINA